MLSTCSVSWVKLGGRNLHVVLLNIMSFCEDQHGDGHTFVMGINEVACAYVP